MSQEGKAAIGLFLIDPDAAAKVAIGLEDYSKKHSVSMKELTGSLRLA